MIISVSALSRIAKEKLLLYSPVESIEGQNTEIGIKIPVSTTL